MKEKTPKECKHGDVLILASNPIPMMIEIDFTYVPYDLWCCNKKVWTGWLTKEKATKEFCKDCKMFEPFKSLLEENK